MPRVDAPVMLVGSVPLATAEEVLAVCAGELGGLVGALPDGETGYRTNWINYRAYFVHHPHPQLETLQRPAPVEGIQQWSPSGFADLWNFRVRDGVQELAFGRLFYAEAAPRPRSGLTSRLSICVEPDRSLSMCASRSHFRRRPAGWRRSSVTTARNMSGC